MRFRLTLLAIFLTTARLFAQEEIELRPLAEVEMQSLGLLAIDNRDNIFVSDASGGIYQFNAKGEQVNHFSPSRQAQVTQLDADRTVNIFSFSYDLQEFNIFDRFLNQIVSNKLDSPVGIIRAATLGNNQALWVFDESNLDLLKLDHRRMVVLQHQPLSLLLGEEALEIEEIREYQNLLFVRTDTKVFVFDNQGNYLRQHTYQGQDRLALFGNHLYYVKKDGLRRQDYRTGEVEGFKLPDYSRHAVQLQGGILVLYNDNGFQVFENPFR
ncbi:hypothetical protein KIH41_05870 [Litoribacter ruber]|uniref:Uncharacterized protein n=1 Tax=Litoribacter ruber TaxID=702568 RepID=A0AAP2CJQ6_9BACT|nr:MULTISPECIES: hypothetical protein [Litoribacter]MBS9523032.1 hypothetical protein [Litoribacter alkaliphilus]MBT0810804.1 hypothetical protein [Litoribacter ruber]